MPDVPENLRPLPRRPAVRRPLPDAQAILAFVVPEAAPPYDDVLTARPEPSEPEALASSGTDRGSGSPGTRQVSIAGTWPSQFAQILSEALAGSRPASQLAPWTTEQARKRISQLGPMLARREVQAGRAGGRDDRQPRVRRVFVTSPVHGVLEMTVIVDLGSRSRAVAVRLECRRSQEDNHAKPDIGPPAQRRTTAAAWLCTAVEAA
jgi:Family of unknown function (DUF6459)